MRADFGCEQTKDVPAKREHTHTHTHRWTDKLSFIDNMLMHVFVCVYFYVYLFVCLSCFLCLSVYVFACLFVCVCLFINNNMVMHVFVCICVCPCVIWWMCIIIEQIAKYAAQSAEVL